MRPTNAIVNVEAIRNNLEVARRLCPSARNLAVIKANAYGHGAVAVAQTLELTADALAVAFMEEAAELREAGIARPILVLEGPDRGDDIIEASRLDLWLMLHREGQSRYLQEARLDRPVGAWVKFDTGMHRLGFDRGGLETAMEALVGSPNVAGPPVLCTHLACADERDSSFTREQIETFRALAETGSLPMSLANSAGIMYWPDSHADWNRPGYMLYGNCPDGQTDPSVVGLQPAMSLVSEIMAVRQLKPGETVGYGRRWEAQRPSLIGTVPIGYADGYPRHAPNGTPVMVRGQTVPLVGTVSMDMITVDLTDLPTPRVGEPVELWGEQLSVNEVAAHAGTIGYELLAGLTGRVPLSYVDGSHS